MTARLVEVIYVDSEVVGTGKDQTDPMRRLEQFFTKDGKLICQYDPEHGSNLSLVLPLSVALERP